MRTDEEIIKEFYAVKKGNFKRDWMDDAIMDEATEARIKMNLLLERIVDAMKTT